MNRTANTSTKPAEHPHPIEMEMQAYDGLPPELREVFRDCWFDVSVVDALNNKPLMTVRRDLGDVGFAGWAEGFLQDVYRNKIMRGTQ